MGVGMTYSRLKPEHVSAKLERFFIDNPDEELKIMDVAVKFECSRKSVEHAIRRLKRNGIIETMYVVRRVAP